jgi:hypothetical protein
VGGVALLGRAFLQKINVPSLGKNSLVSRKKNENEKEMRMMEGGYDLKKYIYIAFDGI